MKCCASFHSSHSFLYFCFVWMSRLIGALNAVLLRSSNHLYKHIFVNRQYTEQGCYGLHLCVNGKWTTVVIDDRLPCDNQGHPLTAVVNIVIYMSYRCKCKYSSMTVH